MAWRKPFSNQGGYSRELPPEDVLDAKIGTQFDSAFAGTIRVEDVAYYSAQNNVTGTIKITLPFSWTNSLIRLRIVGAVGSTGQSWELIVSGFNLVTGTTWSTPTACMTGRAPFSSVRFAHDGTNCCILLGTTATVAAFPRVVVQEVLVGSNNASLDWANGWSTSLVTSETGITVTQAVNGLTGATTDYWRGDNTWQDLATAVRSVVMTGISFATAAAVLATDTLLAAVGKLQAQINSINTALSGKANAGSNSDITNLSALATATWAPSGRIYGKFDASTTDTFLQNTTANSVTRVCIIPSGTGNGALLYTFNNSNIAAAGTEYFRMGCSGASGSGNALIECSNLNMLLNVNGAERLRALAASPDIYINTTVSPVVGKANGIRINNGGVEVNQTAGTPLILGVGNVANSIEYFYYSGGASPVNVGSISTNGTNTTYNTSSDYRLKDLVTPLDAEEATSRIMAYEPCTWVWKTDGSHGKGFIAHKNQAIDPDTATGSKDAVEKIGDIVDADGTVLFSSEREPQDLSRYAEGVSWVQTGERPVYQGRDDSKMIPDMIAMMQRQETRIAELETQLQQVLALLPAV